MNGVFTSRYTVTIGDINYGGHLGNERALVIFQDARIRYLQSLGLSEKDIGGGVGIVVVESGCRYLRQIFLHDELSVKVAVEPPEGKKFTLKYEVMRKGDDEKVLTGFTVILAYNYALTRVVVVPDEFKKRCEGG